MRDPWEGGRRATRIVATLGPASAEEETIRALIRAGVDVFRCNFSHGDHAFHGRTFERIRRAARTEGKPVAILQDLQGPKIRVGDLPGGGPMELAEGREVFLVEGLRGGDERTIPVTLPGLVKELREGERVLLADGTMALVVLSIEGDRVRCRVEQGGLLLPHKGVNLPGTRLSLPCLTSKDLEDLAFGLERGVDYVALSFVRKPEDMLDLRERIRKAGSNAGTVAKIERPEAVRASEEILDASDAVMVARGDLGVELGAERVPIVQKQLIQRAREKGVPVITATEMLESMTEANRPTRAEASDVANAIEDGTSALMLSGETASGKHPVRVVETMDRIARYSERTLRMPEVEPWIVPGSEGEVAEAVVHAACRAAGDLKVRAMVVFTRSGATARKVARYRLKIPVYAFTPNPEVQRKMSLFWGVDSRLSPGNVAHPKELLVGADEELRREGAVRPGDLLVMVAGYLDVRGTTNTMRIWVVGKDGGMD